MGMIGKMLKFFLSQQIEMKRIANSESIFCKNILQEGANFLK